VWGPILWKITVRKVAPAEVGGFTGTSAMSAWLRLSQATQAAGCAVLLAASMAAAQDSPRDPVEQFFRGKTINIYVGSPVGGGYDGYARLLGRHFGDRLSGQP